MIYYFLFCLNLVAEFICDIFVHLFLDHIFLSIPLFVGVINNHKYYILRASSSPFCFEKKRFRLIPVNKAGSAYFLCGDELFGAIKSKVCCIARKRHAHINKRQAAAAP